jgi:hypothetical protein
LALKYAERLATLHDEYGALPLWAKQMPAFVMSDKGDKDAALDLMINLIKDEGENVHPNEVNFMVYYICERILEPHEAQQFDLCGTDY